MEYAFMQRAVVMALVVGVVAGVVGSFVLLRGCSLMGDAISHAVLPGVAMSYAVGINLIFGAMTMGLATAVAITYIQRRSHLKSDTAMGVVFSAAFALGVIVIAEGSEAVDPRNILFDTLLASNDEDG